MAKDSISGVVTVTEEELNRDPDGVLRMAAQSNVAICQGDVPVAVMISGDEWMEYVRRMAKAGIVIETVSKEQSQ